MDSLRSLRVNGSRLLERLHVLAQIGATPKGGVNRPAYSQADLQARARVREWMRAASLEVSVDAAGNLIGRRRGREPELPPLALGSHVDSVPDGGSYDGPLGSLAALEVAQTLAERRIALRHPLEVIIFQNEEGGLVGSRALSGELREEELGKVAASGCTVREGIRLLGGDPDRLAEARRHPGEVAAFLELHIEQGGVLEAEGAEIGVVEGIVGIRWWEVTIEGAANHAGTTPMRQRRDALLAAARFIQAVNRVVTRTSGTQVGTVGRIQAQPGAPNVIPGRVVATLELRDLEEAKIGRLYRSIRAAARRIARESGTTFGFREIHANSPAPADERIRHLITKAAAE
ncbi:MAG: Zn-dependent hydrolase, partial [Gemmatimonadetes bacterium]|nr:Zn-dependent hydrolase [Gemmatimonadota bacterium]